MPIIKKLTKVGNSWGIILSSDLLKMIGLTPSSECELDIQDHELRVRPHLKPSKKNEKVAQAMNRFMNKYRLDLKKLAE